MPTPKDPALSEERIAELRDTCEGDLKYHEGMISMRCAETTLALITSRQQAIELLREAAGRRSGETALCKRIAAFLEENQ